MISKKDIDHLATLSRLQISETEADSFRTEIESILEYVAKIQAVSVQSVSDKLVPSAHNVLREDVPEYEGGEYTEALVKAAPYSEDGAIKVKNMF